MGLGERVSWVGGIEVSVRWVSGIAGVRCAGIVARMGLRISREVLTVGEDREMG